VKPLILLVVFLLSCAAMDQSKVGLIASEAARFQVGRTTFSTCSEQMEVKSNGYGDVSIIDHKKLIMIHLLIDKNYEEVRDTVYGKVVPAHDSLVPEQIIWGKK
jgi:hypothetical protein